MPTLEGPTDSIAIRTSSKGWSLSCPGLRKVDQVLIFLISCQIMSEVDYVFYVIILEQPLSIGVPPKVRIV